MLLGDRKLAILRTIIDDYIVTAEPIGSRTIAKSTTTKSAPLLSAMKWLTWRKWAIYSSCILPQAGFPLIRHIDFMLIS